MPIVKIELFPGRNQEVKVQIAYQITQLLTQIAKIPATDTTVIFEEVERHNWYHGGQSHAAAPLERR